MAERISRRRFLRLAVAAAAGTALFSTTDLGPPQIASAQNAAPAQAQTPLEALKGFEDKQGNTPLTVGQAHKHLDYVGDWVSSRNDGIYTDPELLKKSTFFLTRGSNISLSEPFDRSNIFKYPEVLEFARNYPNIDLNEGLARSIIGLYRLSQTKSAFGMTVSKDRLTYLNLDMFNQTTFPNEPQRFVQYFGDEPLTSCQSASPVVVSRSVSEHEWAHLEGLSTDGEKPLDDDVIKSFKKMFQKALADIPEPKFFGRKKNFEFNITVFSQDQPVLGLGKNPLLNEFSTDHFPIRQAQAAGLAYIIGYGFMPVDHINLSRVLDHGGLPLSNFAYLYKGSYVSEFYQSLALGAQVGPDNPAKLFSGSTPVVDLIGFSIVRFPPDLPPNWNSRREYPRPIKPHFPIIDGRLLTYSLDRQVNSGCLIGT